MGVFLKLAWPRPQSLPCPPWLALIIAVPEKPPPGIHRVKFACSFLQRIISLARFTAKSFGDYASDAVLLKTSPRRRFYCCCFINRDLHVPVRTTQVEGKKRGKEQKKKGRREVQVPGEPAKSLAPERTQPQTSRSAACVEGAETAHPRSFSGAGKPNRGCLLYEPLCLSGPTTVSSFFCGVTDVEPDPRRRRQVPLEQPDCRRSTLRLPRENNERLGPPGGSTR